MPSIPSQADRDLADRATEAGWPTTPSQVQELRERRVLPSTVVTRRGRGITTSEYPPGALDVLLAMRQASARIRQHHRAVVLAWLRGADVGDGEPVTDKGLRWSLLRLLDEVHRLASKGTLRPHRRIDAHLMDEKIPDPTDRRIVLNAIADLLAGRPIPRPTAEFTAEFLAPLLGERMAVSENGTNTNETNPDRATVLPAWTEDDLAVLLRATDPVSLQTVDLSVTAASRLVAEAGRELLDELRDEALHSHLSNASDQEALGVIVGGLLSLAALPEVPNIGTD